MDDRRFDALTKLVGRRASRRALVKAAVAGVLAAVVGSSVAEAAVPSRGGVRLRVKSFCTPAGSACRNTLNPTRRCCYKCGPGKKCCEAEGYACLYDSHCCDGLICRDPDVTDGEDIKGCFVSGELQPGAECLGGGECESGVCAGGECCDPALVCNADPYDPGAGGCCDPYAEECTTEDACCPIGNVCYSAVYGTSECCDPATEACIDVAPQSRDYHCIPWP